MKHFESFYPVASRLKADDIFFLSYAFTLVVENPSLIGKEALVLSVFEKGDHILLNLQVDDFSIGTSVSADTPVELKPPF